MKTKAAAAAAEEHNKLQAENNEGKIPAPLGSHKFVAATVTTKLRPFRGKPFAVFVAAARKSYKHFFCFLVRPCWRVAMEMHLPKSPVHVRGRTLDTLMNFGIK